MRYGSRVSRHGIARCPARNHATRACWKAARWASVRGGSGGGGAGRGMGPGTGAAGLRFGRPWATPCVELQPAWAPLRGSCSSWPRPRRRRPAAPVWSLLLGGAPTAWRPAPAWTADSLGPAARDALAWLRGRGYTPRLDSAVVDTVGRLYASASAPVRLRAVTLTADAPGPRRPAAPASAPRGRRRVLGFARARPRRRARRGRQRGRVSAGARHAHRLRGGRGPRFCGRGRAGARARPGGRGREHGPPGVCGARDGPARGAAAPGLSAGRGGGAAPRDGPVWARGGAARGCRGCPRRCAGAARGRSARRLRPCAWPAAARQRPQGERRRHR